MVVEGASRYQLFERAAGARVMRLPDEPLTLNFDDIVCTPLVPKDNFCTPDEAVRVPQ